MIPKKSQVGRDAAEMTSVIGADMSIVGDIVSHGSIHVEGTLEGDVAAESIVVGEHGEVRGNVRARSVRVLGKVSGDVRGQSISIGRTAAVLGTLFHEQLEVEKGATVEFRCKPEPYDQPQAAEAKGTDDADGRDNVLLLTDAVGAAA